MAEQNEEQANLRRASAAAKPASPEAPGAAFAEAAAGLVAAPQRRYLIGVRPMPGTAPMATEAVLRALNVVEGVEILRHLRPSAAPAGGSDILVARMDERRGEALRQSAPFNLVVEPDAPLQYTDAMVAGPGTLPPFAQTLPLPCPRRDLVFRVLGERDRPLEGASVFVYGSGIPARATTDAAGQASLAFWDVHNGDAEPRVRAVHVKPAADHWDRLVLEPSFADGVNQIQLRPLAEAFPNVASERLVGWGARLMRRDLLPDAFDAAGVRIGLIDSGCDTTHPLLRHVAHGLDAINPGRPHGWTLDPIGHGTHCAGIIAGHAPTPQGPTSFAPRAELHVLKVFPGGRVSDLIAALEEGIRRQLDIVGISAGCEQPSELLALKLAEARQLGVACIAAAGTQGGPVQFPAVLPDVLGVSAIGRLGEFPPDSFHALAAFGQPVGVDGLFAPNFAACGPHVAVAAPGVAVLSTVPGGGYAAWDGNGIAAAHVVGFAAVLLACHPAFQGALRGRGAHRAGALLDSIRAASAPLPHIDPGRVGAGVPDLQRIAGWAAARQGEALSPPGGAFGYPPAYLAGLMQLRAIGLL